jgi:queuine tRNA-ribosyltransferase
MTGSFTFELLATDGAARRGRIQTPRGVIDTPAFMPVGTAASVKAMMPEQVAQTGAQIILGNTYHLMLRPTAERVRRLGGLHRFMRWNGPILTDSGGYQAMSLGELVKINEEGVAFRSHIDGGMHALSPERACEIQALLGSDIEMVLDECTPYPATQGEAEASMERSMRWAERSRRAFLSRGDEGRAQFGIVQGGVYGDLRRRSIARLQEIGFEGYAVGGLAVGEGQDAMFRVLNETMPAMPEDRPRYLMGVGKPDDIIGAVLRGIDMFDCVLPTRSGRHGQAFTKDGAINLKNAAYAEDEEPLDRASACPASSQYSKAYLHHLVRAGEMLAAVLLTWHNLAFYQDMMSGLRLAIERHEAHRFTGEFLARYRARGANIPPYAS